MRQQKQWMMALAWVAGMLVSMPKASAQEVFTVEKALEIAYSNSPDIRHSLLNLERSEQNLKAQRAGLKSKFSLDLTPYDYYQNREYNDLYSKWVTNQRTKVGGIFSVAQPIIWTDGVISLNNELSWQEQSNDFQDTYSNTYSNNLYLSLDQPIFTYNRTKVELQELELAYENSNLSYEIQRLNIEKLVSQAFYDVYQKQMQLIIAKDEYDNQKQSFEIIKNKVDGGLVAKEELYQAELNLMSSQSDYENRQVGLEDSKDNFKQLTGMNLNEDFMALANVEATPIMVDLKQAIEHGLASRMELRQREISMEEAQFDLIKTAATNEFKGNVSMSVGIFGDNEAFSNIYDQPTRNPRVKVSFKVPLWDWGEKKARMRAAEATQKTRELDFENEQIDIVLNIRKVYRNLKNLLNQIRIAEKNVENAQLTYDINLERYKNGDLTGMDLQLHQNQLSEKKIALTNAQISYKLELLNLKIQSLYDFEKQESIVPESVITNHSERKRQLK